jgi:hypothetical protein
MKFIVKTPSQLFDGKRAGVRFRKGTAEITDKNLVPVFEKLGYTVEEVKPVKVAAKPKAKSKASTKKSGE